MGDDRHRLVIDDPAVSRHHLEIRLDVGSNHAEVIDTSTNGTRVNGLRIARANPVAIRHGDRLTVGDTDLEFRSERFQGEAQGAAGESPRSTVKNVSLSTLAMVVGDIVSFSTISQYTDDGVLFAAIDRLYGELNTVLAEHRGTLNNYVGDAFFAIWECENDPDAAGNALRFALAAARTVQEVAPTLPLRDPDGQPIHMGWGVVMGRAAMSSLTHMLVTVLGDTTNLAFRISGLAGRAGHADVVVTGAIRDLAGAGFTFDRGDRRCRSRAAPAPRRCSAPTPAEEAVSAGRRPSSRSASGDPGACGTGSRPRSRARSARRPRRGRRRPSAAAARRTCPRTRSPG